MQSAVVIGNSFECDRFDSLNLLPISQNDRDDHKITSDALYQTEFYH